MYNVIGDIAGNFKTLMALLDKMPEGTPLSVGDMVDRGPHSKEVVEFFMNSGEALFGNHEHLMVDHLRGNSFYGHGTWFFNGGGATYYGSFKENVPENVINWIEKLPLYKKIKLEDKRFFISHSFMSPEHDLKEAMNFGPNSNSHKVNGSIIWNRSEPERKDKYGYQICGHNSQFGHRRWSDEEGEFAMCLDSSSEKMLTGIHLPTMEVFQQPYIDEDWNTKGMY